MRKNSFTDNFRNAVYFQQGIFRDSCKFFVILAEGDVSDSSAMCVDGVSDHFIIFSVVERDGAIVASALKGKYSPPTKNSTESVLSHEAAQISRELFCFGAIWCKGALRLRQSYMKTMLSLLRTASLADQASRVLFHANLTKSILFLFSDFMTVLLPFSLTSKNLIMSLERRPSRLALQNSADQMLLVSCPLNSPTFYSPLSSPKSHSLTLDSDVASSEPVVFQASAVGHFLWLRQLLSLKVLKYSQSLMFMPSSFVRRIIILVIVYRYTSIGEYVQKRMEMQSLLNVFIKYGLKIKFRSQSSSIMRL